MEEMDIYLQKPTRRKKIFFDFEFAEKNYSLISAKKEQSTFENIHTTSTLGGLLCPKKRIALEKKNNNVEKWTILVKRIDLSDCYAIINTINSDSRRCTSAGKV